jgi:hypothetical protein
VNLHDDLVDVAMTFGWLRRPPEIAARWPGLLAGLRRIGGRVKAEDPSRRGALGLGVAIDWCHRSLSSVPLSEEAWAEAEGLVAELKAMAGTSGPRGASTAEPRRPSAGGRQESAVRRTRRSRLR